MSANLANIKKWHDALLSGKYPQTTGVLRRDEDERAPDLETGYCCLGVAVECAIEDGVPLRWTGQEYTWQEGVDHINPEETLTIWDTELPPVVQSWLGVHDDNPELVYDEHHRTMPAITLNDTERWSFADIAKAIEKTWLGRP